jgi:enoyl-CoA hydratase/carnithine racemase
VEAQEAYRIGLLNHLVPRAELRAKTMELAKAIAANHRGAVIGVKALMLQQLGQGLAEQFDAEREYIEHVQRGAKAKDAFPDFIKRKGLAAN